MGKGKAKKPKAGSPSPEQKKQPVAGAAPSRKKRAIPAPVGADDNSARLVFGLQLLDHDGSWPWSGVTPEHIRLIAEACKSWESMRALDVFQASGNKPVGLEKLCADAQKRLVEVELDEYDELWELRVSGEKRLWGVRQRHVFYLVWWDPSHEVCPSKKKHT